MKKIFSLLLVVAFLIVISNINLASADNFTTNITINVSGIETNCTELTTTHIESSSVYSQLCAGIIGDQTMVYQRDVPINISVPVIGEVMQRCYDCYASISIVKKDGEVKIDEVWMDNQNGYLNFPYTPDEIGEFEVTIRSISSDGGKAGFTIYSFLVTEEGEQLTPIDVAIYLVLLAILVGFFVFALIMVFRTENPAGKFASIAISYLLLFAASFVSWNLTQYLIPDTGIEVLFWLSFLILSIGAFPFVIGLLAWWTISIVKMKEVQDMVKRGFPLEDAEDKVYRKSGGLL